ncbi:MAG: cellulase family glycosylhydrolase [Anaerolineae bacterium]
MTRQNTMYILITLTFFYLLSACAPQAPVLVYVTPTPGEAAAALIPTVVPTSIPATPTLTETATETLTVTPDLQVTPLPTNTPLGAVIGNDYVLPPTSTSRPTATLPPPTEGAPSVPTTQPTNIPAVPPTAPGPAPTALPNLDAARMGIQLDPNLNQDDWHKALNNIQKLGVKWLKLQISWKQLQPNGPDEISEDFRRLEIYIEEAFNSNLDILISVAKAPAWARSNQTEDGPPDDPAALATFINLMLNEFGTSLDAIEIWNEPNLSREWQGQPLNGASYMKLFAPSYNAISAYSERMKTDPKTPRSVPIWIISAGLAPTGDSDGSRNDRTFLQEMYNAGLGQYPDVYIGIHPYGWANPPDATCCQTQGQGRGWDDDPHFFFLNNIQDFRQIVVNNNHASAKFFATEFGYATWDGFPGDPPQPWMAFNDRWAQGNYTVRAFQLAQSFDFMGPVILWNLNVASKPTITSRDEMAAYSIMFPGASCQVNLDDPNLTERPSFWMLYDAIRPDINLDDHCGRQ